MKAQVMNEASCLLFGHSDERHSRLSPGEIGGAERLDERFAASRDRAAKKHNIHIVVGLVERDGYLIYDVAVLIGPDGRIIGKYRKVCLPRGEVDAGLRQRQEWNKV